MKFTAATKHKPLTKRDSEFFAPVVPYTYEDARGVKWNVLRTSDGWRAGPQVDAYGLKAGSFPLMSFGAEGTSDAAASVIRGMEEHAQAWTTEKTKSSGLNWLLVVAAVYLATRKSRR
jgi:hypothetical protein